MKQLALVVAAICASCGSIAEESAPADAGAETTIEVDVDVATDVPSDDGASPCPTDDTPHVEGEWMKDVGKRGFVEITPRGDGTFLRWGAPPRMEDVPTSTMPVRSIAVAMDGDGNSRWAVEDDGVDDDFFLTDMLLVDPSTFVGLGLFAHGTPSFRPLAVSTWSSPNLVVVIDASSGGVREVHPLGNEHVDVWEMRPTTDGGFVVVGSYTTASADLGLGPLSAPTSEFGAFVAKFDASWKPIWASPFSGSTPKTIGPQIERFTVDAGGTIFLGGLLHGRWEIAGTTLGDDATNHAAFIAVLDPAGTPQTARLLQSPAPPAIEDSFVAALVPAEGGAFVTGYVDGVDNVFLARMDESGSFLWRIPNGGWAMFAADRGVVTNGPEGVLRVSADGVVTSTAVHEPPDSFFSLIAPGPDGDVLASGSYAGCLTIPGAGTLFSGDLAPDGETHSFIARLHL